MQNDIVDKINEIVQTVNRNTQILEGMEKSLAFWKGSSWWSWVMRERLRAWPIVVPYAAIREMDTEPVIVESGPVEEMVPELMDIDAAVPIRRRVR